MSFSNKLQDITSQFETSPDYMSRINTYSTTPNYTTLKLFQEAIDDNAMPITTYTADLGHLALTRKPAKFKTVNVNTPFVIPTNSGDVPTPPARIIT